MKAELVNGQNRRQILHQQQQQDREACLLLLSLMTAPHQYQQNCPPVAALLAKFLSRYQQPNWLHHVNIVVASHLSLYTQMRGGRGGQD
jgi:hypothetical protein